MDAGRSGLARLHAEPLFTAGLAGEEPVESRGFQGPEAFGLAIAGRAAAKPKANPAPDPDMPAMPAVQGQP